jgi:hypothetical protein
MSQEIRDNQRNLATELKALPGENQQLQGILEMAGDAQHARPAKQPNDFRWTVIRLSESAWNTAASSGALAHMDYAEARRYAQLYELQQMFNANMDRYVDSRAEMYAFLNRTTLHDKPSQGGFELGEQVIAKELVMTNFLRELGTTLNAAYGRFLGETTKSRFPE